MNNVQHNNQFRIHDASLNVFVHDVIVFSSTAFFTRHRILSDPEAVASDVTSGCHKLSLV
jgi:hypothetical protein